MGAVQGSLRPHSPVPGVSRHYLKRCPSPNVRRALARTHTVGRRPQTTLEMGHAFRLCALEGRLALARRSASRCKLQRRLQRKLRRQTRCRTIWPPKADRG
eukprot:467289-Alexandrium_andersonii.AAC.1